MSEPFRRYRHVELREAWHLDDLAALWTDRLRAHTGIPVTITLTVEEDSDDDGSYLAVRIADLAIPDDWWDRLGAHAELLTGDGWVGSEAFEWCWREVMAYATMRPYWDPEHQWVVTVIREVQDTDCPAEPSPWDPPSRTP